jgi:hypothetical protein
LLQKNDWCLITFEAIKWLINKATEIGKIIMTNVEGRELLTRTTNEKYTERMK